MNQWTMVTMTYDRIPCLTTYTGNIQVDLVELKGEGESQTTRVEQVEFEEVGLEEFIACLHNLLQKTGEQVKVTMIRPIKSSSWSERTERAMELSKEEVDIIKNDLPKALEMFAPINRTRDKKEKDNANEH